MSRIARVGSVAGWLLLILGGICFGLLLTTVDPLSITPTRFFTPFLVVFGMGASLTFLCSIIWGREQARLRAARRQKIRQVFAALDWNAPEFARAQKLRWIWVCLVLVWGGLIFTWEDAPGAQWLWAILIVGYLAYLLRQMWLWGATDRTTTASAGS